MQHGLIGVCVLLLVATAAGPAGGAQTDWEVRQTVQLESEPLDAVVAPRSRRMYILDNEGQIRIYSPEGKLKGQIKVGADVSQIKAGPVDNVIFLLSRKSKSLRMISVDLTENIDVKGSPFKGSAKAPVTIAVFSDFQ